MHDVQRVARSYLGTTYVHQGRTPGVGLDCGGLPVCIARDTGLYFPDHRRYTAHAHGVDLRAEIEERMDPIAGIVPGCLLLLWIRREGRAAHLAIASDYGMIHAHQGPGRVVEHTLDEFWAQRVMGCYSWRRA